MYKGLYGGEGRRGETEREVIFRTLSNYQCTCYLALGLNDFDAGKSITQAIERGGGLKISTFHPF
jgi:hypothetical protein